MRFRGLFVIVLLPLLLGLAWLITHIGMADALAKRDPEAALRWWPRLTRAQLEIATREATAGADLPKAQTHALAALDNSPLAGEAFRVLAQIAEHGRDQSRAASLYAITAKRAPRDRSAHAWLANDHLVHGRFSQALLHIDQLLRLAPSLMTELEPTLGMFAGLPEARIALLRLLGEQDPPWRSRFLHWFANRPEALPNLAPLFSPLRSAPVPLNAAERKLWIDRLMRESRISEAYFIWIDGLPEDRRAAIGNVFDGGFELPPENGGFGWHISQVAGATIRQEPTQGVKGEQALVVDFHDQRVPFAHVQQRLALPAGDYALNGRVRVDGLRNERGLQWVIRCDSGTQIAASNRFIDSSEWRDFLVAFTRPSADCNGQVLQLRLDARIAPEQMIGGRIWFDELRVLVAAKAN